MNYRTQELEFPAPSGRQGKVVKVTAHIAGDTGLAYHVPPGGDEEIGFVITHLASMKALGPPMDTEYEVKLLMQAVAEITDWHQSEHEINKQPKIAVEFTNLQADIAEQVNQRLESTMKACVPEWLVEEVMDQLADEDFTSTMRKALMYALKIVD